MPDERRKFSTNSNGDRWYLITDVVTNAPMVMYEPGHSSDDAGNLYDIESFIRNSSNSQEASDLFSFIDRIIRAINIESTSRDEFLKHLRDISEDSVDVALAGSKVALPLTTPYEALEFFNCMLDIRTGQRAADLTADATRIPVGFGSTR